MGLELRWACRPIAVTEPFVSHKGTTAEVRQLVVELRWQDEIGYGGAVPARDYGMSEASLGAALTAFAPLLRACEPTEIDDIVAALEQAAPTQPAAVAAVEMALQDLRGKRAAQPLHALFGFACLPLPPTALSLGIGTPAAASDRATLLTDWPILKLKMSVPDVALVEQVRAVYGGRLWIDGNGAWEGEQAVRFADRVARYDIELIEQPVPADALAALRFVHERVPMLVVADEACRTAADLERLAGHTGGVNIKLLKCGGLERARDMIERARHLGLAVMLGCKTESALGITAITQLGGGADFLDVDGHLDLVDDPFEGIEVVCGRVSLPARPGLGVRRRAA